MADRRTLLKIIGATGSTILTPGCSDIYNSTTPSRSKNTTRSSNQSTNTPHPTNQPTDTNSTSESEQDWSVNPLKHSKIVGAHYYAWYRGENGYGLHQDYPWLDHVPAEPVLGQYDSRNEDVINQHIQWALEHGINLFLTHGPAPKSYEERTLRNHVFEAELASEIQFALSTGIPNQYKDANGRYDLDNQSLREDLISQLRFYQDNYFSRSNYLKIDDKPVLNLYGIGRLIGDVSGAFREVRSALNEEIYVIADPQMGYPPGFAWFQPGIREYAKAFDAMREYNMYPQLILRFGEFAMTDLRNLYEGWRVAAEAYDLDFIPMALPGADHTHIKWKTREFPVLERTPTRFQEICSTTIPYLDPDLDMVILTSFNEWPEYTAIEPAKSYGTTYLEVVEAIYPGSEPNYIDAESYIPLLFDFNKTVGEQSLEDGSREIALQLGQLDLETAERTLRTYQLGVRAREPVLAEGVYRPEQNADFALSSWRWLGGPSERAELYLHPDVAEATQIRLRGRGASDEISADLRFNGRDAGELRIGDSVTRYTVSLV